MTSKNDGGAAFAAMGVGPAGDIYHEHGMSLRDWFAGQVLISTYLNGYAGPGPKQRAQTCYEMADAMLAERSKP